MPSPATTNSQKNAAMQKNECPACHRCQPIRLTKNFNSGLECGSWLCANCGFEWDSLNGYPIRRSVAAAISYRRTHRFAALTFGQRPDAC